MKLLLRNKIIFPIILFIISIFIYCFAPSTNNHQFNIYCFVQYIISILYYFKSCKKNNYFDFDVIFLFAYAFVMFVYPVFIHSSGETFHYIFSYNFDYDLIPKGTALALVGSQAYLLGAIISDRIHSIPLVKFRYISSLNFSILILYIAIFIFVALGGITMFSNLYSAQEVDSGIPYYILLLIPSLFIVSLAFNINNSLLHNKFGITTVNVWIIGIAFLFCAVMLSVGSRTVPLQIILAYIGIISTIKYKISLKLMLPIIAIGALLLSYVQIQRSGIDINAKTTYSFAEVFLDLIINNRNTYVALEYVDREGFTFGKSMLAVLLAPIPFLQRVILVVFNIWHLDIASSLIITKYTFGDNSNNWPLGLGTNVIADLYMSFGLVGVIWGMLILGYAVNYYRQKAKYDIYSMIVYMAFMSYSVYLVRSEFLFPLRLIVWSLVVANILRLHQIKLIWHKRKY